MNKIFLLVKMVQLSPVTDEGMNRNEENMRGVIRPPDPILVPGLCFGATCTNFEATLTPLWE